jgi:hypothetical protein
MSDADTPSANEPPGWPPWVKRVLLYANEPALWPVLFAIIGHVVVVLAPLLLAVFRDRFMPAGAILFVFVSTTLALINSERRATGSLGALTGTLVVTWSLAVLIAGITGYYGVL